MKMPPKRIIVFMASVFMPMAAEAAESKTFNWVGGSRDEPDSWFDVANWQSDDKAKPSVVLDASMRNSAQSTGASYVISGSLSVARTNTKDVLLLDGMNLAIRDGAEWKMNGRVIGFSGGQNIELSKGIISEFGGNHPVVNDPSPVNITLSDGSRWTTSSDRKAGLQLSKGKLKIADSVMRTGFVQQGSIQLDTEAVLELSDGDAPLGGAKVDFTASSAKLVLTGASAKSALEEAFKNGQLLVQGKGAEFGQQWEDVEPGDNVSVTQANGGYVVQALMAAGGGAKLVAISPVLEIKFSTKENTNVEKVTPPEIPKVVAVSDAQKKWQDNRGGKWIGGDRSDKQSSFHETSNWSAPDSPRSGDKGYDLTFSGARSRAKVGQALKLLESSSLIITDSASLSLNKNEIQYSGKSALVVDGGYVDNLGKIGPVDKDSSFDLIVTNNAMVNAAVGGEFVCDFSNGSLLITDSTCSFSSLMRGKVKITGYGSVEVGSKAKQAIEGTTIDMTSERAQFRFVNKPLDKVISEDLDKFSIFGELPIYGQNPETMESGDNILIRNDGGVGTIITVVK